MSSCHVHLDHAWDEASFPIGSGLNVCAAPWHSLTVAKTCFLLRSSLESGLSNEDVVERRELHGTNELPGDSRPNFLFLLARHVLDFLMILLLVASGVSFGVGEYVDGAVILVIAVVNVFVGAFQEFRAEKTLEALRQVAANKAVVIREGVKVEIPAADLVPGDMVELNFVGCASAVPADMRVVEVAGLEVIETTLTGESRPVSKTTDAIVLEGDIAETERFHRNFVYAGTNVSSGRGQAVVVKTGMETELGKIASHVTRRTNRRTDLQKELQAVSIVLFCVGLFFALVVFASSKFHVDAPYSVRYSAVYAIAMIVAIIPEELPLVLTLTLVLGVRRMTQMNVIVRQMSALEQLGRVTDICSDKTGTITQARMVATRVWTFKGHTYTIGGQGLDPAGSIEPTCDKSSCFVQIIRVCSLCNTSSVSKEKDEWIGIGQPTDIALRVFSMKLPHMIPSAYEVISEFPFDSDLKRMSVVVNNRDDDGISVLCKGAAERVFPFCNRILSDLDGKILGFGEDELQAAVAAVEELSKMGLRVLAIACRGEVFDDDSSKIPRPCAREEAEQQLVLVGLVGLQDPPRPGVREAVQDCLRGGIAVHMLTGDHVGTAASIAKQVAIAPDDGDDKFATSASAFDQLKDSQIDGLVELPLVVARCTPESKVKMVNALHRRQRVVAMTGDGVNDAPAISAANIGVAMGKSGSDVTRQAAHIVLSDDNFVSIVDAVREGRRMYLSIKKFVVHVLATNVGMVLLLMVGLAFRDSVGQVIYPQSALEILVLNMFVLSVPLVGLVMEPPDFDVMAQKPRKSRRVLTADVLADIIVYGISLGSCAIAVFVSVLYGAYHGAIGLNCNATSNTLMCEYVKAARASTFLTMALAITFSAFNSRYAYEPVWHNLKCVTRTMWIGSAVVLVVFVLVIYIPVLNTIVFHHGMITWEWGLALAGLACFVFLATCWKLLLKPKFFPQET